MSPQTTRRKKSLLIATAVLGGSLLSVPASAHLGHTITRAERYLKIDASEGDTRVVVSLTLGADEGMRMLESADTNQDGTVSQAEADAHLQAWGEGLRAELPIEVNGEPVEVVWTDAFFDPMGEVRPLPVTLEMVAHVPVQTREATIVVRDAMVRREIFERTDVGFQAHDGAELVLSGSGDAPLSDRHMALSFGPSAGEAMPGSISASFHYPNRSEAIAWQVPAIGAFGVTVLGMLGWLVRRRMSKG